jgi:hypothetical protein
MKRPQGRCKKCSVAKRREWNLQHPERYRDHYHRQYKRQRDDPELWEQHKAIQRERRRAFDEIQERRRAHAREYERRRHNRPPERWRGPNPNAQGKPRVGPGQTTGRLRRGDGPLTWATAVWADGVKVVAWLEAHEILPEAFGVEMDTISSAVRRWRNGRPARIDSVDNILTRLGVHVSELPDEVWLAKK